MTESFEEYYDTFKELRDETATIVRRMADAPEGRQQQLEREARGRVEEMDRYLIMLGQEAKGGDAKMKRKMQTALRVCNSDVEKLKNNLQKARLVGDAQGRATTTGTSQDRLNRTGVLLDDSKAIIEETRAIAIGTGENLARQGDMLRNAQRNAQEIRIDVSEAGDHLASLKRKNMVKIICLWIVIIGLIVAIIVHLVKTLN
ncbi:hypothetical protein ACHHYP_17314 [Achlya hypogyna]|uniref:Vesicle transport v-SNARE N-terminal domain-containing protein n=1 Tax=Achlya hypogyna TaxID=1202772 RepID=A0A1V9ZDF6_ACHHY|nr:hypothetical protein ACHHYP_17314 [Achlya hypogyna]